MPGQTPKDLVAAIFSKSAQPGLAADARLVDYVSTIPHWLAVSSLQDCAKLDLSKARNPSAYVVGVLQRQVASKTSMADRPTLKRPRDKETETAASDKGYEGGRVRGGKKVKEKRAKSRAAAASGASDSTTVAAAVGGVEVHPVNQVTVDSSASGKAPAPAENAAAKVAGSRQKARGGSESKRRREEARASKRAQWQGEDVQGS